MLDTALKGSDGRDTQRRLTVRALVTLCVLLASGLVGGCNVVLGLEDHEVGAGTGAAGSGAAGSGATGGGGGSVGGAGNAGSGGLGGAGGVLRTLTLTVTEDEDDCLWTIDTDGTGDHVEQLYFDTDYYRIFVSTDVDAQRIGLRFPIGELAGATITSAHLVLVREAGNNAGVRQVRMRAWDTPLVNPFTTGHAHGPEGHVPQGFWTGDEVTWTPTGDNELESTPDLSALVQHAVDHPDFTTDPDPHVGLVIFPVDDGDSWFVGYQDSGRPGGSAPPRLELEYIEY